MAILINPNVAFLFAVTAILLLMLTAVHPESIRLKVGMLFCLGVAAYQFLSLRGNPWSFLILALSPLPFFVAIRQTRANPALLFISFFMLAIGSFTLYLDQNGRPAVDYGLAGMVSLVCGTILWITLPRLRNVEGARPSDDPDSVVGLIGECRTDIEAHSTGSVMVEGELWQAYSKTPIPAGSTVRVVRQDGSVLTVKKIEKIPKR